MRGSCSPALTSSRRWRSVRQSRAARLGTSTSSAQGMGVPTSTSCTTPPVSNRIACTSGRAEQSGKRFAYAGSQSARGLDRFEAETYIYRPSMHGLRGSMEGSAGIWDRVRQKPFALWVIFGGFVYLGLVILSAALPALVASPASVADPIAASLLVFMVLFFISAYMGLKGKRWTSVLTAFVSVLFFVLFGSFLVPSLANPADAAFWLAISGIPALILVAIFSILSIFHAKTGLLQKRYLATPNSAGGLLTIGVIGFVVGGLIVGAIGGRVILRNISAAKADITIVPNAPSMAMAFTPQNFTLSVGSTVTWVNKDTTGHTVTSNVTGLFGSPLLSVSETWSHTFSQAGIYHYHCTPHPQMWGVIVVS